MSKKGKFGKSLFGFKRADVIDYIEQSNSDSISAIKERDDSIAALTEQLNKAKAELDAAKAINDDLKCQIKAVELEFAQMRVIAAELKSELDKFDAKSKQIGEVYVEAKVSADKIIKSATENAESIVTTAKTCAAETLSEITDAQSDIASAKRSFYDMMSDFDKRLDAIAKSILTAKSKISPAASSFTVNTEITEDDLLNGSVLPNNNQ